MQSWNHGPKNVIRTELMNQARKKSGPADTALMIPSHTCLCVEEALKSGIIDQNTYLVAIERRKDISILMAKRLKKMGMKNVCIVVGELTKKLKGDDYFHFDDGTSVSTFDFVYIDTCCHLSPSMQRWISNILPKYTNLHSQVAYTFINSDRRRWYWNENPSLCNYTFSKIEKTNNNCKKVAQCLKGCINSRVKYGRAYKNGKDDAPMITLLMGLRKYADRTVTGSKKSYDLGYLP